MVGAEEGNGWIYKNKDHGAHMLVHLAHASFSQLVPYRHVERGRKRGLEYFVGYGGWSRKD